MPATALRRDAQRNRSRLLVAAHAVFAAEGAGGSLEEIARRAGVGVGTLYRHFPSRSHLIEALFEHEFERWLEASRRATEIAEPWEALETYVLAILELQDQNGLLAGVLLEYGPGESRLAQANAELAQLAEALLARARASAAIRPDFGLPDLAMLVWSFAPLLAATKDAAPGAWRRQLTVFLDGLRCASPTPHSRPPLSEAELVAAMAALREARGMLGRR